MWWTEDSGLLAAAAAAAAAAASLAGLPSRISGIVYKVGVVSLCHILF